MTRKREYFLQGAVIGGMPYYSPYNYGTSFGGVYQTEGAHSDYDNNVEGDDAVDNGAFGDLGSDGGEAGAF